MVWVAFGFAPRVSHPLGPVAIQSLLFIEQMAGLQESKLKPVTRLEFSALKSHTVSYTYGSLASCRAKLNRNTEGRSSRSHGKGMNA